MNTHENCIDNEQSSFRLQSLEGIGNVSKCQSGHWFWRISLSETILYLTMHAPRMIRKDQSRLCFIDSLGASFLTNLSRLVCHLVALSDFFTCEIH